MLSLLPQVRWDKDYTICLGVTGQTMEARCLSPDPDFHRCQG